MAVRYSTCQLWDEHVTGSTVGVNMALTDVIEDSMTRGGENQCMNLFGVLHAVKDGSVTAMISRVRLLVIFLAQALQNKEP
jgi:hypothetical protein